MKLFKNEIGRPTNEIKKKRKLFVASIATVAIVLVAGVSMYVKNNINTKLNATALGNYSGDVDGDGKLTLDDTYTIFDYLCGDVTFTDAQKKAADYDKNGKINTADVQKILKYLKSKYTIGDVNNDGKVSVTDAIYVLQYASDMIKEETLEKNYGDNVIDKMDINEDGTVDEEDATLTYLKAEGGGTRLVSDVLGDIDGDGKITSTDARLVLRYVNGKEKFSDKQKRAADIDQKSGVTKTDAIILQKIAAKLVGDMDGDGIITETDAKKILRMAAKLETVSSAGDIDQDGKVTAADARIALIIAVSSGTNGYYAGDVNKDGKVTITDANKVLKFAAKLSTPSASQKKLADINQDGKITAADARIILNIATYDNVK